MRGRVDAARVARFATVTSEGRPHIVPRCFVRDGNTIWSAVDAKPKTTLALRRLSNLNLHPQVTLLIDHYEDWEPTVVGARRRRRAGADQTRRTRASA